MKALERQGPVATLRGRQLPLPLRWSQRLHRVLRKYVERRGVFGALFVVALHPYYWVRKYPARRNERVREQDDLRFDRKFGVDTSGSVRLRDLAIDSHNWIYGERYDGTPGKVFVDAISSLPARIDDKVFVDMGSGKGRTLLLASEFPFKRVIGVEFARALHEIAVRNIGAYQSGTQRCRDIESVCCDAAEYELPLEPLLCYFQNPFSVEVMERVLAKMKESFDAKPREILIQYVLLPGALQQRLDAFAALFGSMPFLAQVSAVDRYWLYRVVH